MCLAAANYGVGGAGLVHPQRVVQQQPDHRLGLELTEAGGSGRPNAALRRALVLAAP